MTLRGTLFAIAIAAATILQACGGQQPTQTTTQSAATSPSVTPTPVPKHMLTAIWTGDKAVPGPIRTASAWAFAVTWAVTNTQGIGYPNGETTSQMRAAGLKVAIYSDPNHWTSSHVGVDNFFVDGDIARACDGTKIQIVHPGQKGVTYLIDVRQQHVAIAWNQWLLSATRGREVEDAVFEDTSDNSTWYAARPTGPCAADGHSIVDATTWTDATKVNERDLSAPVIFNGLNSGPSIALLAPDASGRTAPALGGESENCYGTWNADRGPGPYTPSFALWSQTLVTEIAAQRNAKMFFCAASINADGSTLNAIAERIFMLASLDLDADPDRQVISWHFPTASGVTVQPEAVLIVTNALTPAPKAVADLLRGQAYVREYADCYMDSFPVGGCAIIVNPRTHAVPNPLTGYSKTLALTGSGWIDGGMAGVSDTKPPATLAPSTAVVAFK